MNLRNTIKNIAINENMQFGGEEGEAPPNKMEISQLLRKHFEMMLKNPEYKNRHDQMSQMLQIGTDQNMMQQGQGQQPPMGGAMPPMPGMGGGSPMGGGMPPMPRMGGQQQGQGQQPPKDPFMQMAFGNRGGQQGQQSSMGGGMPPMPRMGGGGSPMGGGGSPMGGGMPPMPRMGGGGSPMGGGMPPMPPQEDDGEMSFGAEFDQGMQQQPPMGGMMGMRKRPPMF